MPRFFFDIHDGQDFTADDAGTDCADEEDARKEAIRVLPQIAKDTVPNGDYRLFWVKVRNASGADIFHASLELKSGWLNQDR
jgi:hypothetical protein